jgi:hypothetical protein
VKAPSLESLLHLGSHGRRQSPRLHQSRLARWKHCLLVGRGVRSGWSLTKLWKRRSRVRTPGGALAGSERRHRPD